MEYTVAQLQQMCGPYRHVVAKSDGVFELVLTEVSTKNVRSMGAHRGIGFRELGAASAVSEWRAIVWDWT